MRYTQEQMEMIIKEWEQSGLSKKAFCKEREIADQTFHYWYKRLRVTNTSGFTEINVGDQARSSGHEIIFPSGTRMIFQGEPSVNWLRELVG